jgi:hypothetical protein
MPNPWKSFSLKRLRAASERGRKMAKRRWEIDRERRDALARMDKREFNRSSMLYEELQICLTAYTDAITMRETLAQQA